EVVRVAVGRVRPCRGGDELGEQEDRRSRDEQGSRGSIPPGPPRAFRLSVIGGFVSSEARARVAAACHGLVLPVAAPGAGSVRVRRRVHAVPRPRHYFTHSLTTPRLLL